MLNLLQNNTSLLLCTILLLVMSILMAIVITVQYRRLRSLKASHVKLSIVLNNKEEVEKKLAAEEARFQSMFEDSPDPTWIIDNHQFTLCNSAAVQILGYPSKEALDNTHPSKLSPEFQPDGEASYAKAERMMHLADERGLHRFEWIHTRLDGSNFPAEVTLSRMTMKGRQVIYCVWRDISERKEMERKEIENQQLLTAIIENAAALVYVCDINSKLILCNQQFEKAVGYPRSEILGKVRTNFLPAEIAHEHYQNDLQVLRSKCTSSFEETNLETDGLHTYLTIKNPLYSDKGEAWAVIGISTDITARKRSENEGKLAATVFRHIADGIIITDIDATIISVNQAFSRITGYAYDETYGQKPSMLQSERQDKAFYEAMWHQILENGMWQGEIWNRRKNGEIFPAWQTITSVKNEAGETTNYVSVFSDITEVKQSQERLERLAHYDALTELPNRVLFKDRVSQALEHARRHHTKLAIVLFDLDGFKTVNDSLGHPIGDRLLQLVAQRLSQCMRAEDTVSRLGGDEFAVLITELNSGDDAIQAAHKILQASQEPYHVNDHAVMVTSSVGISIFPDDTEDGNDLIRNADAAMYEAKAKGRNTYCFYQAEMTVKAQQRLSAERDLRRAIEQKEFEVWYQPQIDLSSQRFLGAEALIRWRDPLRGLIPPLEFIPLAEQNGMILPIGEFVLHQVCADFKEWQAAQLNAKRLSVNVAGPQFYRSDIVATIKDCLSEYQIPAGMLEIEVTETFMMENPQEIKDILLAIQELGVTIAIDDFGTGYSSLAYLRELPIDTLKIDRAFIRDIPSNNKGIAIVRAILALGSSMGFNVVAEGVETQEQSDFLQAEGCRKGQGYYFAKPMPKAEFTRWLQNHEG
ncbi:sensor domain-containing protein [Undibacterium flavidum]|uniref:EAL domain-containing protein n=1 Tax=Undibacterium flavidum TaxID=2762297 RepID=A0ABR6YF77_9BURK|nr:EAL domain-containing protein [Undibacterium flavidum]MBC3875219.1 EAL domain-containing protein [Undibacterium flavidum]